MRPFWILDFGFWIGEMGKEKLPSLFLQSKIQNPKSKMASSKMASSKMRRSLE